MYVLIMLLGAVTSQSGLATIETDFTSYERCERARQALIQQISSTGVPIKAHGCFPK